MRRELVTMGAIAAVAGIGLAALLTAALGTRSSGPPAPLKTTSIKPAVAPAKTKTTRAAIATKPAHAKPRHERRPRHVRRPPTPSPAPVIAEAETPATTQTQ